MSIACPRSSVRFAAVALLLTSLAGCATGTDPRDPLEPFNRGVYEFNEVLDKYALKPVAQGYQWILPQPIRMGVSNFFSNINDVSVMFNNVLQGKFVPALDDFSRIFINSSIGLLGLINVASDAGIQKHDEDFGQTLGVWGVPDGPYIVLPFFGPSGGRDAVGRVGDFFTDPLTYVDPTSTQWWLWGTRIVSRREELLDATTVLDAAALDRYEFLRDAYLQRRRNLIYDGRPPLDKDLDIAPPREQKGDVDARDKTVAAVPAAESSMAASEDHVPQIAVRAPEMTPVFPLFPELSDDARAQSQRAENVAAVGSGAGFESGRREISAGAKTPAPSAGSDASGASVLKRVWRYVEPRETPVQTLEGS